MCMSSICPVLIKTVYPCLDSKAHQRDQYSLSYLLAVFSFLPRCFKC
nr:MAG TPA: hypothetical protein [Caudoviricetes sp.]